MFSNTVCRSFMHDWNVTPKQAIEIQKKLASTVSTQDEFGELALVGGLDVGFEQNNTVARAAAVTLTFPDLEPAEYSLVKRPVEFPYVPGLLSFREIPAAMDALEKLSVLPDIILCDGHGLAHPRRFGMACHLGIVTGIPTIGVAKKLLVGEPDHLDAKRGSRADLWHKNEKIGLLLRTREDVKPVYVSVGHKMSLSTAADVTLACTTRYRLPETTRLADRYASNR